MKKTIIAAIALFAFLSFPVCQTPPKAVQEPVIENIKELEIVETAEIMEVLPEPQSPLPGAASMRIQSIDSNRAIINVIVNFENPNVFEIPSPRILYNYQLNRISFIRGMIESEKPLAASSVTPVSFRLMVSYADLFRSFTSFRNLSEVPSLLTLVCEFANPVYNERMTSLEIPGILPIRR